MAGSHGQRRKEVDARGRPSDFWRPMTDAVRGLLQHLSAGEHSVVLFGELYGSGVQDMAYGLAGGAKGFRAFDVAVDGKYLDHDAKAEVARPARRRDGPVPLPGTVLLGGGRGAHLRPDDDVPARRGGSVRRPGGLRHHSGRGAVPRRAGRLGPGDPQVDLGRLPGRKGGTDEH